MRIAIVGGRHKSSSQLLELAAEDGHQLEFHAGDVRGRGAEELRRIVARSDLVVILTEINSHGGVLVAKRAARREGKPTLVLGRLGAARFRSAFRAPARTGA